MIVDHYALKWSLVLLLRRRGIQGLYPGRRSAIAPYSEATSPFSLQSVLLVPQLGSWHVCSSRSRFKAHLLFDIAWYPRKQDVNSFFFPH